MYVCEYVYKHIRGQTTCVYVHINVYLCVCVVMYMDNSQSTAEWKLYSSLTLGRVRNGIGALLRGQQWGWLPLVTALCVT